jgi:hypothetical protein
MTALANGRQIIRLQSGVSDYQAQKGATKIYAGAGIMVDSSNYAKPGAVASGCFGIGLAKTNGGQDVWDTTNLADGAKTVEYEEGTFLFGNSAAADALLVTDAKGLPVFFADDQTVAKTSAQGSRSPAGRLHHVDSRGVWVTMSYLIGKSLLEQMQQDIPVCQTVVLSKHSNGSIAARFTPGFKGRIKKVTADVIDPVTTGAKLATFTAAVAGVSTTGGAVALTSANCTPVGAKVDGTAITAGDTFAETDEITAVASAVTAFVEGQVTLRIFLERVQ